MRRFVAERAVAGTVQSKWRGHEVFARLQENRLAAVGLAIILLLIVVAVLAPFIAPHDPIEQNLEQRLLAPSMKYPLGTDDLGRCVLSRLIYGARVSLRVGVVVVGITVLVGTFFGLIAGYWGAVVDEFIMRIADVFLAFPGLVLALVIAGLLGPGLFNVMLALAVVGWTRYARVVRGCVLSAKERAFVEAARAMGGSDAHVMIRHVLPEVMAPVIVMATLGTGGVILAAAALSFLGLGAQPPTPEWGNMVSEGRDLLTVAPWITVWPGMAIMFSVLGVNLLGDGLRDALDPKLRAS